MSNANYQHQQQQISGDLMANRSRLRAFIRKSVDQEADVDDIFQLTLMRVLERSRHSVIEQPLQYAYRVARNLTVDMARGRRQDVVALEEEPVCERTDLELQLDRQRRLALYQQTLQQMPALRREVFVRYRLQGQSKADIGQALALSPASVDKHITRALSTLKQAVEHACD